MSAFPAFRLISSASSNPLVVEVCPRVGARYFVWMDSAKFTVKWQEETRAKILQEENAPKSPLIIPESKTENEPYTGDRYESDSEDEKIDYDSEFDSQWKPKVDLTPYENPNNWIKVDRRKRSSVMKAENEVM